MTGMLAERRGVLSVARRTIVNDTFTDADATTLASHVGETGATWTQHSASTSTIQIRTNRVRGVGSTALYIASGVMPSPNYDVIGDFTAITDNNSSAFGLAARFDAAANTRYWCRWTQSNDTLELQKTVAGTGTSLGSNAALGAWASGSRQIILRCINNQISVYFQGALAIGPITDSAVTGVGFPGLYAAGTGGDAVGLHLETFQAIG